MERYVNAIKLESLRLLYSKSTLVGIGVYWLLCIFVITVVNGISPEINGQQLVDATSFPNVWIAVTSTLRFGLWLLMLLFLAYVQRDFQYKTIRNQILDGGTRSEWLLGKVFVIFVLISLTSSLVTILGLVAGISATPDYTFAMMFEKAHMLVFFWIKGFFMLSMGLLFITFTRNTISAFIVFMGLWLLEAVAGWGMNEYIEQLLPYESVDGVFASFKDITAMITGEAAKRLPKWVFAVLGLGYSGIAIVISFFVLKHKSL